MPEVKKPAKLLVLDRASRADLSWNVWFVLNGQQQAADLNKGPRYAGCCARVAHTHALWRAHLRSQLRDWRATREDALWRVHLELQIQDWRAKHVALVAGITTHARLQDNLKT